MAYENIPFDIIIQAGQSNAEGCGKTNTEPVPVTNEKIITMERDFSLHVSDFRHYGDEYWSDFSLSFAWKYAAEKLTSGRSVLIIRAAVGGTGFCDKRWGMQDDLYIRMMEMIERALAMNPENRIAAFIWHQGETDCGGTAPAEYVKLLSALVNSVRDKFSVPDMPFIAGNFVPLWRRQNPQVEKSIGAALREVCATLPRAAFVETDGLFSNHEVRNDGDTIHFGFESQLRLGKRYYRAYRGIVK